MSDTLNTDERAELLAELALTTGMVSQILKMLTDFLNACRVGRVPTADEIARFREHAERWREQLAGLQKRIASAKIEPPRRSNDERSDKSAPTAPRGVIVANQGSRPKSEHPGAVAALSR
jgi:hypothetical protein